MPISLSGSLIITGSITAQSITGSISGSLIGNANSASFAQTASSADNFVVRQGLTGSNALFTGAITAQTLVVQTVTSSIVYSSGSNTFGNQLTDVQQMTGSLRVTGSGNHYILGGNLGLDTATPGFKLDVNGTGRFSSDVTATLFTGKHYTGATYNFEGGYLGKSTANGGALLELVAHTDVNPASSFALRHDRDISGNLLFQYASPQTSYSSLSYTALAQLTTDGNLGLGVTPSAWNLSTNGSAIDIGTVGTIISSVTISDLGTEIGRNYYYGSTGFIYKTNGAASRLRQSGGIFYLDRAPVGTAGASLTFTSSMVVDANGRLGIGTTSPNSRLSVNGGDIEFNRGSGALGNYYVRLNKGTSNDGGLLLSTDNALDWQIDNSAGNLLIYSYGTSAAAMYILRASGNVGIGTTSPFSSLDVSTTSTGAICVGNSSGTISSGDLIGAISFVSRDVSTYSSGGVANIRSYATATYNTSLVSADLRFYTTNGVQNTAADVLFGEERMRITSAGSVGIGMSNPNYRLGINSSGINSYLQFTSATTGTGSADGFIVGSGDAGAAVLLNRENTDMVFYTNNTERMTISGSGNVGIGTTTPLLRCHILGSTGAFPSTSGTTQTGGVLRLQNSDSNGILDIGGNGGSGFWLQTTNATTFAANYSLLLNPNGGNVGIGTTTPTNILEIRTNHIVGANGIKINSTGSSANQAGIALAAGDGTTNRASRVDFINNVSSATVPRWTIINDYSQNGTNDLSIVNSDPTNRVLIISQSGNVGIGTTTPANLLTVNRSADNTIHINTTTSGNGRFTIGTDSSANVLLRSQNSVDLRLGVDSSDYTIIKSTGNITLNSVVYNNTAAATVRTLYIGGDYVIGGVSSTRESKTNIENITDVNWLYELNPVSFNYRKKDASGSYTDEYYEDKSYGLIAEDTAPVNDLLCNYNQKEDGSKELVGIEYPRLIVPLLKAVQELKAENTALKSRIEQLETKIQ